MCKETNTVWKAEVDLVERMELQRDRAASEGRRNMPFREFS